MAANRVAVNRVATMRRNARIGVVIPALDEDRAIGKVVAALPSWPDEIIVVDNGSVDATAAVARAAGARVVSEPIRGYGRACQTGLAALGRVDVLVFLDGDFSDYPEEMAALVDPILDGRAEFVVGSRVLGKAAAGALTPVQRWGNWLAVALIGLFYGQRFTDLGPFRAIARDALERLAMADLDYGWTVEMQIKAARLGLGVLEVPVRYRPRIGVSKISGTFWGSIRAGKKILFLILREFFCASPFPPPADKNRR